MDDTIINIEEEQEEEQEQEEVGTEDMVEGADEAYEFHVPEMLAVKQDELEHQHIPVELAVRLGLVAARNLAPYAEELAKLPGHTSKELVRLDGLSRGTYGAWGRFRYDAMTQSQAEALLSKGYVKRGEFTRYVSTLEAKGIVPQGTTAGLPQGNGFLAVSRALDALVRVLERHWPAIEPVALYTKEEIAEIKTLGGRVFSAWAQDRLVGRKLDARGMLARSFSLLKKQYMKTRKAAFFVLDGVADVDKLIPPFTAPPKRRTEMAKAEVSNDEEAPPGSETSVSTAAPAGSVSTPVASTPPSSSGSPSDTASRALGDQPSEMTSTPVASTSEPATSHCDEGSS